MVVELVSELLAFNGRREFNELDGTTLLVARGFMLVVDSVLLFFTLGLTDKSFEFFAAVTLDTLLRSSKAALRRIGKRATPFESPFVAAAAAALALVTLVVIVSGFSLATFLERVVRPYIFWLVD